MIVLNATEFNLPPEMKKLQILAIIVVIGIVFHRHVIMKNKGINNTYGNRTFFYCIYVVLIWTLWLIINSTY